jgi:hypothetical protein
MEHLLKQLRASQAAKAEEVLSENLEVETAQIDKVEMEKNGTTVSAEISE